MLDWTKSRWFALLASFALASSAGLGCAAEDGDDEGGSTEEEGGASTDDIVNGNTAERQTEIERQSIGNCWLYATTGWIEASHLRVTGESVNFSESYLTYWHWYEQIANSFRNELSTGGSYNVAINLIDRYGLMAQADFIPGEETTEMSAAQARAETYINNSLKSGKLATRESRQNRELVREELNQAFGLSSNRITRMNRVFGRAVTRTVDRSFQNRRPGFEVIRAKDFVMGVPSAQTHELVQVSLADAMGSGGSWSRSGPYAHQEINFPYNASGHRSFQQRIQRALHDGGVPIMSWKVDFNALDSRSRFSLEELERRGPGSQGGHMVSITDYEATLADGTVLKAGVDATPEQLEQALTTSTSIDFFRIKNSWGKARPDRWNDAELPGYHDLTWGYLSAKLLECPDGFTNQSQCSPGYQAAFWSVVLPAGY